MTSPDTMGAPPQVRRTLAIRRICDHTRIANPSLCPEIRLRLATPSTLLWRATEAEALALGFVEPYWAFCWPGGHALARWLLDAGKALEGRRVLDFGTGCGIAAIAAALRGARVTACDTDPMAVLAATLNAKLNGVQIVATTEPYLGRLDPWDLIVVGDVTYEPALTREVLAWLRRLAQTTPQILVSDPRRGFLSADPLDRVASYCTPGDNDADGNQLTTTDVYRVRSDSAVKFPVPGGSPQRPDLPDP